MFRTPIAFRRSSTIRVGLLAALATTAALLGTPAQAAATDTQFALTCIGTETSGKINFQYRWGQEGSWKRTSVEPGEWAVISYRYSHPGKNSSPQLELRFDDDMGDEANYVRQKVVSYAARSKHCESQGATYNFVNRRGELFLTSQDV